jgi:hypothetical protein
LFSINRPGLTLFAFASLAAAQGQLWEPGKVVSVEQVSTPAKAPDPSCKSVPRGTTPPVQCRPANLRAEQFWRVTVDVGNKRFVVRPYREPKSLDALSEAAPVYVDPNLTQASPVQVAILSKKSVRIRTDQGPGLLAIVDSQELLSKAEIPVKAEPAPQPRSSTPAPSAASTPVASIKQAILEKVVLLENSDFLDMEVQEFKTQDIGDGAALYSFSGESSATRLSSNPPVFLLLADNEAAMAETVELVRLQVSKGTRQLAYSVAKRRSASSLPVVVTQVSGTVRKISMKDPLPSGSYVVLLADSHRGFLFDVR